MFDGKTLCQWLVLRRCCIVSRSTCEVALVEKKLPNMYRLSFARVRNRANAIHSRSGQRVRENTDTALLQT